MAQEMTVSRFRWMLAYLAASLRSDEANNLKNILKDLLGEEFHQVNDAAQIFDVLEKKNAIHAGNVDLLITTFNGLGFLDLVEEVERYEKEKSAVLAKERSGSSLVDGPFFGRQDLLDSIIGVLEEESEFIHAICISGMPGSGKTRLAQEACYRLVEFHQLVTVDLRELKTIEAVFFAILHKFGKEGLDFELDVLYKELREFRPTKSKGAVLLLDSVDYLLDPGSKSQPNINHDEFMRVLKAIVKLQNPLLKVLITSRIGLEKSGMSYKQLTCYSLDEENTMTLEDSVAMLRYHAGRAQISNETAEELAKFCMNVPLAIRVIGSRFQDGNIQPDELLKYLKDSKKMESRLMKSLTHLGLAKSDQLSVCFASCIRALPRQHKENLIRLSVIPGSFTIKAARDILGVKGKGDHITDGDRRKLDKIELQLDLQALMYRSLLESDRHEGKDHSKKVRGPTFYSMHLLLRSFIREMCRDNQENENIYQEAEGQFIRHYGGKLRKICKLMENDYVSALSKRDEDYVNYQEVLRLLQTSSKFDDPQIIQWLHFAVNHLFDMRERRFFFFKRATLMKQIGNYQGYSDYKTHEVFQLLVLGDNPKPLLQMLDDAQKSLKKCKEQGSKEVQLSYAHLYHIRGDVLSYEGRLFNERRLEKNEEALPWLEKAYAIRKKFLGKHYLIARTLLSLGNTMQAIGVLQVMPYLYCHNDFVKALDHYQEALDMLKELANNSLHHIDMPNVLLSMGACMHEMGRYKKAIELYQEALKLEEALGISGTSKTCTLLKNTAMSYFAMEQYDNALTLAKDAMEGRRSVLQTHHNTARAIYFVGYIYLKLRQYGKCRQYLDMALNMEEDLWKQGRGHSEDWANLKEKFDMLFTLQDERKTWKKYHRRFKEAERKENQKERKPEEDKSEEEESISSSSEEGEFLSTGSKRRLSESSSSASSLSSEEKAMKTNTDHVIAMDQSDFSRDQFQEHRGKEPSEFSQEINPADVQVKVLRYDDPDFDDHDSIEDCYGLNPRRGPYVPPAKKKDADDMNEEPDDDAGTSVDEREEEARLARRSGGQGQGYQRNRPRPKKRGKEYAWQEEMCTPS